MIFPVRIHYGLSNVQAVREKLYLIAIEMAKSCAFNPNNGTDFS